MIDRIKYAYYASKGEKLIRKGKTDSDEYIKWKLKVNKILLKSLSKISRKGGRA